MRFALRLVPRISERCTDRFIDNGKTATPRALHGSVQTAPRNRRRSLPSLRKAGDIGISLQRKLTPETGANGRSMGSHYRFHRLLFGLRRDAGHLHGRVSVSRRSAASRRFAPHLILVSRCCRRSSPDFRPHNAASTDVQLLENVTRSPVRPTTAEGDGGNVQPRPASRAVRAALVIPQGWGAQPENGDPNAHISARTRK